MRGREFYMKDGYSFDRDYEGAVNTYRRMMLSYMRTFQRMGVRAIPMLADTGPIGGDLSHEFIVLAPTGESQVFYDSTLEEMDYLKSSYSYESPSDLAAFHDMIKSY
jgi:prolyl-tRNA synthetase